MKTWSQRQKTKKRIKAMKACIVWFILRIWCDTEEKYILNKLEKIFSPSSQNYTIESDSFKIINKKKSRNMTKLTENHIPK